MTEFSGVRVLVVGDAMLDRYISGDCRRISPEAPVPVLAATGGRSVAGGAANVAANLAALGCRTTLVAGIGRDAAGRELKRRVAEAGVTARFTVRDDAWTTVKTRFVADGKQLLRVDEERRWPAPRRRGVLTASEMDVSSLLDAAGTTRLQADIVVLSDYAKGFLSPSACHAWISAARSRRIPVIVDPKRTDWQKYAGATCVTPNRGEFAAVTGCTVDVATAAGRRQLEDAARALCRRLKFRAVLLTLGADGMAYVEARSQGEGLYLPTQAKEVYDVSGAGDTALAAFAAALGAGMKSGEAVRLANVAAGLAVAKAGTSVVSASELETAGAGVRVGTRALRDKASDKILSLPACVRAVARLRAEGKRIGFTNGCFDCCHLGHVSSIREARALCDVLVVGVNSDAWICRHKGAGRPIQDERTRTAVLAAMGDVDFVVVFGDETAERLVRAIRPDVIAKEGYALADWPEGRLVQEQGGRAVTLKRVKGRSTTAVVRKIGDAAASAASAKG